MSVAWQRWDPERYARNARFVADLGRPVVDLLEPGRGERILDLGCGDGALTAALVDAGADVVGIDTSAEQVAAARDRGIDAHVMCARELTLDGAFDAVFTNAALHWIRDLESVVAGVRRSLRLGGRFVGEFGGQGNVDAVFEALRAALERRGIDAAAHTPWSFPAPDAFRDLLERHGFSVEMVDLFPRPTPLPGDIGGWLETFAETFLKLVPPAERVALSDEIKAHLEPHLRTEDGGWTVDYVRLRFAAVRTA